MTWTRSNYKQIIGDISEQFTGADLSRLLNCLDKYPTIIFLLQLRRYPAASNRINFAFTAGDLFQEDVDKLNIILQEGE